MGNASVKSLRLAACVAISATLLVSGCASGTATITGTLEVGDGVCALGPRAGCERH